MASRTAADSAVSLRTLSISLLAAVVSIVVFAYAWANVSMRLQRHITARGQWSLDQRRLGSDYRGLSQAAAAQDSLAYDLLLRAAQDDLASLRRDSAAMASRGISQRVDFLTHSQACLAESAAVFHAQPPAAQQRCRQLLPAPHDVGVQ